MRALVPLAAILMLAACSKLASAPANEQAPMITDMNAVTPAPVAKSMYIGFSCAGKEKGDNKETTRQFVFDGNSLFELSTENGKLENVCEGFPCRITADDTQINIVQGFTDTSKPPLIRKKGMVIIINRLTGAFFESDDTTTKMQGEADPLGGRYNFEGNCEKEAPQTVMKPKF